MSSSTTVISVAAIVTSGVLGPSALAWWAHLRQGREFAHDRSVRRSEDLREVLDDAAVLLGAGATNLRLAHEASQRTERPPVEVGEWASKVHLTRERILLRLSEDNPVVVAYTAARDALEPISKAMAGDDGSASESEVDLATANFETRRSAFLDAARRELASRHASNHPDSPT